MQAYRTGRGSFRLRARWAVEELGRGQWQVVVTEWLFRSKCLVVDSSICTRQ